MAQKTRVYRITTERGVTFCEAPTREAAGLSEAIRLGLIESCERCSAAEVAAVYRGGDKVWKVGEKPEPAKWFGTPPGTELRLEGGDIARYAQTKEGPFEEGVLPTGPGPWWICISSDEGKTWSTPVPLQGEARPASAEDIHVDFRRAESEGTTLGEVAEAAERLGVTSTATLPEPDAGNAAGTVEG